MHSYPWLHITTAVSWKCVGLTRVVHVLFHEDQAEVAHDLQDNIEPYLDAAKKIYKELIRYACMQ